MRKVTFALVTTAVGVFLLLSYKSHSPTAAITTLTVPPPQTVGPVGKTAPGSRPADSTTGSTPPHPATARSGNGAGTASGTFTGAVAETPFGPIQIQATLQNGKLTDVAVLQETDGNMSRQIDAQALPILKREALAGNTWDVDTVSGATYTSQGYARSLQSALDQAGGRS